MTTIATRLREARHEAGLTQVEVASRTGIDQPDVSRYERGQQSPGLSVLTRLADLYGVSLDWLTGRE